MAATHSAPAAIVAVLAILGPLIPTVADAAHVEWIRCPDGQGRTQGFEDLWPTSSRARLLPPNEPSAQGGATLELNVMADYRGKATCAELLEDGAPDMAIRLDALDLSETYVVRPLNWTCLPYKDSPAGEQEYIADRGSQIQLVAHHDLGVLGLLPAFSTQVTFSASNKSDPTEESSSACIYSEITPQLREDVSIVAQYGPFGVMLLVFLSGLIATLFAPAVSARRLPSAGAGGGEGHHHHRHTMNSFQRSAIPRAILPGVGDCLLHLQFIFFLGALTLRYPGFYQPVTSLLHWSALFIPAGPLGQQEPYPSVNDGIYEINGTLTGTYGLELMSQITGGPMTMDVWRNMVIIAAIITTVVAVVMLVYRFVLRLVRPPGPPSPVREGLGGQGGSSSDWGITRGTWNVLRVVLSYFLTPIVAISAYQLDNLILPKYHLALAALLIVLVIAGVTWMWRVAPSNQLGVLLLDSSKRYRLVKTDDQDTDTDFGSPGDNRDIFAIIFFALAFARGIAVGGLQFSPLAQVVLLCAIELVLLVSTAVLRPLSRRVLSVFTWSGVARLVVVALTAVFLPQLDASISVRSRVAIAILVIHAAVLVLGCVVPATIRLGSLVCSIRIWASVDEPEIYGLSQLRRRSDAVNGLSVGRASPTRADSPVSYLSHNPHSPSDVSSIGFYLDQNSSPDALYLRAVTQRQYFRPPRSSSSTSRRRFNHMAPSSNIPAPSSTNPTISESEPSSPQGESSSSNTTEKPQRPSTSSSEGTVTDAWEPPLAPQWPDYSFREADLYYGRPQSAETPGAADSPAPQQQQQQQQQQQSSTIRRVVSSIRNQRIGRKSTPVERQSPNNKGFEVRRPPKPAGL